MLSGPEWCPRPPPPSPASAFTPAAVSADMVSVCIGPIDTTKARRLLQWEPTPLADAVEATVRWYLDPAARALPVRSSGGGGRDPRPLPAGDGRGSQCPQSVPRAVFSSSYPTPPLHKLRVR